MIMYEAACVTSEVCLYWCFVVIGSHVAGLDFVVATVQRASEHRVIFEDLF